MVAQKRIVFIEYIMERHYDELLKKVFLAQKRNPTLGDLKITYEEVMNLSKTKLKEIIKKNARCAAFEELQTILLTHKKVKHIEYK